LINTITNFTAIFTLLAVLGLSNLCKADELRVAYFSKDPPSINSLSPSFDPDSYAVISQIYDPLIMFDLEGEAQAGLAIKWRQESPTKWRFWLRKQVKFHDGSEFSGQDVVDTFQYILNPKNNAGNRWIFKTIKSVELDSMDPYQVIIHTFYSDGMFINRLNMFSAISSSGDIEKGLSFLEANPNGTGPFKFKHWQRGKEIALMRSKSHWNKSLIGDLDVRFVIFPKKQWVAKILNDEVDFVPNLDGSLTYDVMQRGQGFIGILKRPILAGYWALIKNEGALANIEVRTALNYAINRDDIVKLADHGNALPMTSIGKVGEFGRDEALLPIPYDPNLAIEILKQKKLYGNLTLKVLAADVSELVAKIVAVNLRAVGVNVDLEIVSRSEWSRRVIGTKLATGKRVDYDVVINLVDNPIYHLGFHAGLFLESSSPWSLLHSKAFDELFKSAMITEQKSEHENKLKGLDRYIKDNALMLFTSQRIITAAFRNEFNIEKYGKNGHLDYFILSNVTKNKERNNTQLQLKESNL
jgi:peptide/nickel transport system substrate-binding protein